MADIFTVSIGSAIFAQLIRVPNTQIHRPRNICSK